MELGSSVHSTVARNLPDIFSSGEKKPDEMLELLRERRRSRATLTKAHIIVEQLGSEELKSGVPEVEITESELQRQQPPQLRPSSVSPQKSALEVSREGQPHCKSMPEINMAELLDSDDENDIISKMVRFYGINLYIKTTVLVLNEISIAPSVNAKFRTKLIIVMAEDLHLKTLNSKVEPNQIWQDHRPSDYSQAVRVVLTLPYLIGSYYRWDTVVCLLLLSRVKVGK